MDRRTMLAVGGTALTTAVAGCLASGQTGNPGESNSDAGDRRTISVRDSGTVDAEPDLAVLQLAVEATAEDAATVRDELAEKSANLEEALLEFGIDEDAITTSRFRIRDRVDHSRIRDDGVEPESEEDLEEYVYYEGTHSYTVEVDEIEDAGHVIDTAVDAGADDVSRVQFTLSDDAREELREKALAKAIENARGEATVIATEVDATIVDVRAVDTTGSDVSPVQEHVETGYARDDADVSTDFQPGDVSVRASVQIVYEIE